MIGIMNYNPVDEMKIRKANDIIRKLPSTELKSLLRKRSALSEAIYGYNRYVNMIEFNVHDNTLDGRAILEIKNGNGVYTVDELRDKLMETIITIDSIHAGNVRDAHIADIIINKYK
jgi:hypothetical protein